MAKRVKRNRNEKAEADKAHKNWLRMLYNAATWLFAVTVALAFVNACLLNFNLLPGARYFLDTIIKSILAPLIIGASLYLFHET